MCKLIMVTGEEREVQPADGKEWQLGELQKLVGGFIETFPTSDPDKVMVLHEEGKLQPQVIVNFKANTIATPFLMPGDCIVGDVVIVTKESLGE